MNDTGLMLYSSSMPIMEITQVLERRQLMVQFVGAALIDGTDYGIIPGTGTNKTLLKPGAEKLCTYFGLRPTFEAVQTVEDWTGRDHDDEPFFYYWMRCRLIRNGEIIAEGDGSCNSHESKYRWRWATAEDLPAGTDKTMLKQRGGKISEFGFSVDKAETSGKYGKPASYWQQFTVAIANKTARKTTKLTKAGASYDAWEIDSTLYRIPSDDIASQVNTILKMAQKRALTAATLIGVNASEFFTQDIEPEDLHNETGETPVAFDKAEWQRNDREEFKSEHGYSKASDYATGKMRADVLKRDNNSCVLCGMTDAQHKAKWNRPITVDHIDRDRQHNTMDNLQTLCLTCHGRKDQSPELKQEQVSEFKEQILSARASGETYQVIADRLGFSIASIWKWYQRWGGKDLVEPDVIEGTARIVSTETPPPAARKQASTPTRPAEKQQSAQSPAPTNGTRPLSANTLHDAPVVARSAGMITSEEAEFDASNAEFSALGKAPLSMSATNGASNAELAGLPAEQHWIDLPDTRKKFFAWIGSQGMQDNEAYVALNCKTMHEYTGTRQDAMDAILAYLKRKFAAQARRETTAATAA